jgi:hypothetical protein
MRDIETIQKVLDRLKLLQVEAYESKDVTLSETGRLFQWGIEFALGQRALPEKMDRLLKQVEDQRRSDYMEYVRLKRKFEKKDWLRDHPSVTKEQAEAILKSQPDHDDLGTF